MGDGLVYVMTLAPILVTGIVGWVLLRREPATALEVVEVPQLGRAIPLDYRAGSNDDRGAANGKPI